MPIGRVEIYCCCSSIAAGSTIVCIARYFLIPHPWFNYHFPHRKSPMLTKVKRVLRFQTIWKTNKYIRLTGVLCYTSIPRVTCILVSEKLSTWLLSSGQEFDEKFLDSKHVLKVYFKPSREKKYFGFLPLPILPVWLKFLHLKLPASIFWNAVYDWLFMFCHLPLFWPLNKRCLRTKDLLVKSCSVSFLWFFFLNLGQFGLSWLFKRGDI